MALREFDSVQVGDQLPEKVYPLTRADLVAYAGVSGDLNPIHWDDEIAKMVGLDTAIAHGITQGMVVRQSEATAEWVLRADRYLRSYADLLGRLPPISQTIKSYTAEK